MDREQIMRRYLAVPCPWCEAGQAEKQAATPTIGKKIYLARFELVEIITETKAGV